MCFICGEENSAGLHSHFFNLEDGRVACLFTARDEHQGYPGRMHGGVISAVLDELIGRILQITDPTAFAVTIDLSLKFRKPVPLGEEVKAVAWATNETARVFEGKGEIHLADGTVAVEASAKYLKMDVQAIAPGGLPGTDWYDDKRPVPASLLL